MTRPLSPDRPPEALDLVRTRTPAKRGPVTAFAIAALVTLMAGLIVLARSHDTRSDFKAGNERHSAEPRPEPNYPPINEP